MIGDARRPFEWREHEEADEMEKREYSSPKLEKFGTVADLTQVGQTNPGDDTLPGNSRGKDGGSVRNPGGR
jgi:hypothetical protein